MAFVLNKHSSGKSREFLTASSTTIAKGDALVISSGYVTPAAATDTTPALVAIADEDVTTASGAHNKILATLLDPTLEFVVDCDDDVAQSQVGTSVKFKDKATADNGTTGGPILVLDVLPGKKILAKIG